MRSLSLWANALVTKDERPHVLLHLSFWLKSPYPPTPGAKKETFGEMFHLRVKVLSCLGVWPGTGVALYTWDKVNLGIGRVFLGVYEHGQGFQQKIAPGG